MKNVYLWNTSFIFYDKTHMISYVDTKADEIKIQAG